VTNVHSNLRTNTGICHWKTHKYVWNIVSEQDFFNSKFMKTKYRLSISIEKLVSELTCAVNIKYILHLEDLV
jgi:hypothetical protein